LPDNNGEIESLPETTPIAADASVAQNVSSRWRIRV
jgi:hypothetical protein